MILSGKQKGELREILGEIFDRPSIRTALAEAETSRSFDDLVRPVRFPDQVSELVQQASQQGWTEELITLARKRTKRGDILARLAALEALQPEPTERDSLGASTAVTPPFPVQESVVRGRDDEGDDSEAPEKDTEFGYGKWLPSTARDIDEQTAKRFLEALVEDAHDELTSALRNALLPEMPERVTPRTFSESWYIPRRVINILTQQQTSLQEIIQSWLKRRQSTPIVLLGESGSGKTIEQLKVAATGLFPRSDRARFLPVILTSEKNLGQTLDSFDNAIHNRTRSAVDISRALITTYLDALPPAVFLLDVDQTGKLKTYLDLAYELRRRHRQHLVVITLRMTSLGSSSTVDGLKKHVRSLSGEDFGKCHWFCFEPFTPKDVARYLRSRDNSIDELPQLATELSLSFPNNALAVFLASELRGTAGVHFRGALYEDVITKWYSSRMPPEQAKLAVLAAHGLAHRMCQSNRLQLSRDEAEDALQKNPSLGAVSGVDDSIQALRSLGLLPPPAEGGELRFRHDSFAFFFAARSISHSDWNSRAPPERQSEAFRNTVLGECFGSLWAEALRYLPGLMGRAGEARLRRDLTYCFDHGRKSLRLRRVPKRAEGGGSLAATLTSTAIHTTSVAVKLGDASRGGLSALDYFNPKKLLAGMIFELLKKAWHSLPYRFVWTPSGLSYTLVPSAYRLAFELPALTSIPLSALLSKDRALRFHTIETTVSVFAESIGSFRAGSTDARMALTRNPAFNVVKRLSERLGNQTRSERWIVTMAVLHFLSTKLRLPLRYSLFVGYESLFQLALRIGGTYFDRANAQLGSSQATKEIPAALIEGAEAILAKLLERRREEAIWLIARVLKRNYEENTDYPCNANEIILALQTPNVRERIEDIALLFSLEEHEFLEHAHYFEWLADTRNGYVAWCAATLIAIFGNGHSVHDSVVEWMEDAYTPNGANDVRLYVLQRACTALLLYSKVAVSTPARARRVESLFEKLSKQLLVTGTRIEFGPERLDPSSSSRRYLKEVQLSYGDFLCRRGRVADFKQLFVQQLAASPDDPRHEVDTINALGHIGRASHLVPIVLEVLTECTEELGVGWTDRNRSAFNAVVQALAGMMTFDPITVERYLQQQSPDLRKKVGSRARRVGSEVSSSANYFGDAIFQNLLLRRRARESFARGTVAAAGQSGLAEFFEAYCTSAIDAFLEASDAGLRR